MYGWNRILMWGALGYNSLTQYSNHPILLYKTMWNAIHPICIFCKPNYHWILPCSPSKLCSICYVECPHPTLSYRPFLNLSNEVWSPMIVEPSRVTSDPFTSLKLHDSTCDFKSFDPNVCLLGQVYQNPQKRWITSFIQSGGQPRFGNRTQRHTFWYREANSLGHV